MAMLAISCHCEKSHLGGHFCIKCLAGNPTSPQRKRSVWRRLTLLHLLGLASRVENASFRHYFSMSFSPCGMSGHVWACLGMSGHVWACLGMSGHGLERALACVEWLAWGLGYHEGGLDHRTTGTGSLKIHPPTSRVLIQDSQRKAFAKTHLCDYIGSTCGLVRTVLPDSQANTTGLELPGRCAAGSFLFLELLFFTIAARERGKFRVLQV